MQLSPLQLIGYFVKELSFSVNPQVIPGLVMESPVCLHAYAADLPDYLIPEIRVAHGISQSKEESQRWSCQLEIECNNPTDGMYPYLFRIVLVGEFQVLNQYPEEHRRMLVEVNAPSVLYSAAREILATTTGRGPYPGVMLPAITFVLSAKKNALSKSKE